MDPRHEKRLKTVQNLYAETFARKGTSLPYPEDKTTLEIVNNLKTIDERISRYTDKFPIERMARIDLAILRLAVYELKINKNQPEKVVINEAVELAKELGGEKSFSFVNGILGKVAAK